MISVGLSSGRSLKTLTEETLRYYTMNKNYTLISNTTRTVKGIDAYEMIFNVTISSIPMKQEEILIEKNDIVYVLIYIALSDLYEIYSSAIEESINSFTIS